MKENKKILLASSNKGKINEFKDIFNDYEIIAQSELGISDAVEDGLTFFENALKKARHGAEHSGLFTIADDSGLVVPGLNYEPGIYSARYAGNNSSDLDNRNKIIDELNKLNLLTLPAYYVCVLVGINSPTDPMLIISSGKIHGEVSIKSSGSEGFGYDKIFYPVGLEVSMASIDADVKNNISHRAIATQLFLKELEESNS